MKTFFFTRASEIKYVSSRPPTRVIRVNFDEESKKIIRIFFTRPCSSCCPPKWKFLEKIDKDKVIYSDSRWENHKMMAEMDSTQNSTRFTPQNTHVGQLSAWLIMFHFYPYFAARPAAWDEQVRVRNISIKYSDSTQKSTRRTRLIQPECDYFFEFSLNGRNMRDNWDGHFPPVLPQNTYTPKYSCSSGRAGTSNNFFNNFSGFLVKNWP